MCCIIYIPYSGYYSQGSIFAGGGALCIARVIRGFKIRGPYSPVGLFFAGETQPRIMR